MDLYSLAQWSESVGERCPFGDPLDPVPEPAAYDGEDRALLARLRDEIATAHTAIDGSRTCITESWSLISNCALMLSNHR
jgi:hypothetical protein